MTCDSKINLY